MWKRIGSACNDRFHPAYKHYGAYGASICDEWSTFESFWLDVHMDYCPKLSIAPKDKTKPLSKDNVIWVDPYKLRAANLSKPVAQLGSDGSIVATYSSIQEASDVTGLHSRSIAKVVRGVLSHTGGFSFVKFYS